MVSKGIRLRLVAVKLKDHVAEAGGVISQQTGKAIVSAMKMASLGQSIKCNITDRPDAYIRLDSSHGLN